MARTARNILLGFLSTAVFVATFVLVGDVLIAALAAIAVAAAQFILNQTMQARLGVPMLASLAVVLSLTGLSLAGDDALSLSASPVETTGSVSNCGCNTHQQKNHLHAQPLPLQESPKLLAPARRGV